MPAAAEGIGGDIRLAKVSLEDHWTAHDNFPRGANRDVPVVLVDEFDLA